MRRLKLSLYLWVLSGVLTGCVIAQGVSRGIVTTAQNWSQTSNTALAGCSTGLNCTIQTLNLTPCPVGIDTTSGAGYQVLLSGGGNSEVVSVLSAAGGCTSGAASGKISFTPFYSYAPGYTIGSASSGIQETINLECGTSAATYQNGQCDVTIPANGPGYPVHSLNTYNVYGTIYLHSNQSVLRGYGVSLNCLGRGACIQIGDLVNSNDCTSMTLAGFSFRTPTAYSSPAWNPFIGVNVTNTIRTGNLATITTGRSHGFRPGDIVTILFTDNASYWGDAVVTSVPTNTTFTYAHSGANLASQTTPGAVALAYEAVLDNADNTHLIDISYDKVGEKWHFNNFFDFWDDENATIDHFNNNGISLMQSVNWTGSFIFSAGNQGRSHQIAPVITLRDSTITANGSNGVTDYNSNGLYIENTIIQASGPWEVYAANYTGNYQGAYLKNIYSESGLDQNPFAHITGSVMSGTFVVGEKITQTSTGAMTYLENAVTGSSSMIVPLATGTPDSKHTWIGQTSGAVYAPSSLPIGAISPWPGLGIAGLIAGADSGSFQIVGNGSLVGEFPTGGAGSMPYTYYIVANDCLASDNCVSNPNLQRQTSPMQILNWKTTGRDSILVRWPRVANGTDTITYDIIRMTSPAGVYGTYPYNGGCPGGPRGTCGYVVQGLSQAAACSGGLVCTYTDGGSASTSAYTVKQGTYQGLITFWPGALVSDGGGVQVDREQYPVVGIGTYGNPVQNAEFCTYYGVASPGGYTSCLTSGTTSNNSVPNQTATVLSDGGSRGGGMTLTKGRLNFSTTPYASIAPHHIITLIDSQPALTRGTWSYRPPASANDVWIGTDGGSPLDAAQLAFGSPVSITNYIAQTGDGKHANWLERLSASLKEFNVPAKFDQSISISNLIISSTSPTISSGFGTNASVVHNNGTAVFTVNVGTGRTASSGVIGLPRAANGWAVHCDDVTTQSTSVFITKQTASSSTSATITQYSDAAMPTAWAANDLLVCQASAY